MIDELFLKDMHEAEAALGKKVQEPTEEEYDAIETVYLYHPALLGWDAQKKAAYLYVSYGMLIFWDMLPRAEAIQEAQTKLEREAKYMCELKGNLAELRQCRTLPKEN